jgi:hypothetical protein
MTARQSDRKGRGDSDLVEGGHGRRAEFRLGGFDHRKRVLDRHRCARNDQLDGDEGKR